MRSNVFHLGECSKSSKVKATAISEAEKALRVALAYLSSDDVNLSMATEKAVLACTALCKAQMVLTPQTPPP